LREYPRTTSESLAHIRATHGWIKAFL